MSLAEVSLLVCDYMKHLSGRGETRLQGREGTGPRRRRRRRKWPGSPLSCPRSSCYQESLYCCEGVRTGAPGAAPPGGSPLLTLSSAAGVCTGGRWPESGWKRRAGRGQKNDPSLPLAATHPVVSSLSLSHFLFSHFAVSSDQIEQLHRRFKQLSGDQPTIR